MLPRKNTSELDGNKISTIWILTDGTGKPIVVLAQGHNGELYFEPYSAQLEQLIRASGIPCITDCWLKIAAAYNLAGQFNQESQRLDNSSGKNQPSI